MFNTMRSSVRRLLSAMLCLALFIGCCPVLAESADSETALRQMLSALTGLAEFPYFYYADYDGDGSFEAFAFAGEGDLNSGSVSGDLYFVSKNTGTLLQIGSTYTEFQISGTSPMYFSAKGSAFGVGEIETFVWNVIDGAPVIADSALISSASAEDAAPAMQLPVGRFSYSETGIGECTITGYTGTGSAGFIPSALGGLSVVAIGDNAFAGNTSIVSIAIPDYIKSIGYNAFGGCTALSSVLFAAGLENIGAKAFADCASLASVSIPATVKSIGALAFSGCTALSDVSINSVDAVIDPTAFENCPAEIVLPAPAAAPEAPAESIEVPQISVELPAVEVPVLELVPTEAPTAEPTAEPTPEPTYTPIDEILDELTLRRSSVCYPCNYDVSEGCAIDGKLNTAWNSNDYSVGEWLEFSAPGDTITTLAGIRMINGYIKSDSVYRNNSRVRSLDVYCDGEYVDTLSIADSKTMQTLWLSEPVSGNTFRFEVYESYYGSKYDDLAITEIELMGVNNEDFHTGDFAHWGRAVKRLVSKTKDGSSYRQGDDGYAVIGLQLLLKRGFGLLDDEADGYFGPNTRSAVIALADLMLDCEDADEMEPMTDGVVDAAFMRNLRIYIKTLN